MNHRRVKAGRTLWTPSWPSSVTWSRWAGAMLGLLWRQDELRLKTRGTWKGQCCFCAHFFLAPGWGQWKYKSTWRLKGAQAVTGEILGSAQWHEWMRRGKLAEGSEMGVDGAAWLSQALVNSLEADMGSLEPAQSKPYSSWDLSCGLLGSAAGP